MRIKPGRQEQQLAAYAVPSFTMQKRMKHEVKHPDKLVSTGSYSAGVLHLAEIADFDGFDKTYREFFPGVTPARTTAQSVLWGGIKVEIDAIARVPAQAGQA